MNDTTHLRLEFLREPKEWPTWKRPLCPTWISSRCHEILFLSDFCGNDFSDYLIEVLLRISLGKPCQPCHCVINMRQGMEQAWGTTRVTFLSLFLGFWRKWYGLYWQIEVLICLASVFTHSFMFFLWLWHMDWCSPYELFEPDPYYLCICLILPTPSTGVVCFLRTGMSILFIFIRMCLIGPW